MIFRSRSTTLNIEMNFQALFLSFFAISIVSGLLTFMAIPFFRVGKDSRLYAWMLCNFLYSIGSSFVALELLDVPGISPFDMSNTVIFLSQSARFFSVIGLILFLRSFSPKSFFQISAVKIFLTLFILISLSSLTIGPHVPVQYKGAVVASFWVMFEIIWFLYELYLMKNSGEYQNSYSLRALFIMASCMFMINLYLVLVTVITYFNLLPSLELTGADVQSAVFIIRLLSNLLSTVVFILAFTLWVESRSDLAIQSKSNSLRISNLLIEKDILIYNIANTNALVESGALAAGLAHELNQHLARIQLNAEQAISSINRGHENADSIRSLERITQANHAASRLILSLKKVFRNPHEKKTSIRLDKVVLEVAELYKDRLRKSNIQLDLNLKATQELSVTDSLIRQVLSNLISNAIDSLDASSQSNKKISIDLTESATEVKLEVFDNGPGIHPDKKHALFELFQTSKINGTGIGLWLCKYVVEAEGGKIYAQSPPNGGALFAVQLPV
jgi:signal transduction histidine kinase